MLLPSAVPRARAGVPLPADSDTRSTEAAGGANRHSRGSPVSI